MTPTKPIIDFLPDRYRQATNRRRTSYWRLVVTLLFVGVFAAAAYGLHWTRREVREEHQQISLLYSNAKAEEAKLTAKEAEVAELRTYAELVTFLRHPWPRSRIVHKLFAHLPDNVTVKQLRITTMTRLERRKGGEVASGTDPNASRSAVSDLADLRKTVEGFDVVAVLDGMTDDPPALHAYLQSLTGDGLFVSAEVGSIEATQVEGRPTARFSAQVVIRPGWGLPDGPTGDDLPRPVKVKPEMNTLTKVRS